MRAVIHLHDYDPDDSEIVHNQHKFENPTDAADPRAVVHGVDVEWFPGGGNVHIVDDRVEQVAELMDGSVQIVLDDAIPPHPVVDNAGLVTVYNE